MTEGSSVRTWLGLAAGGRLAPAELFSLLAQRWPEARVAIESPFTARDDEQGTLVLQPAIASGGKESLGVIFSDEAGALEFGREGNFTVVKLGVMAILQAALRQGLTGVVINPGSAQYLLNQDQVRRLFREYAMTELQRAGGAWVPSRDSSLLVMDLDKGVYVVPVYLTQPDAQGLSARFAGVPQFHSWAHIQDRCLKTGAEAAYLQFGFPEQIAIQRAYLARLTGEPGPDPLGFLEQAIARSLGVGNAAEVWRGLAAIERVWTLVEGDGSLVALDGVFNLFTSAREAETFIAQARSKNPGLGAMRPMEVRARALFAALAKQPPAIGINRGSPVSWYGQPDTVPNVLRAAENQ